MKKFINYLAVILMAIMTSPVLAQKQLPPEGGAPKDFNLPQKKVNKLSNGFKTTMVQYGNVPKVTISLIIKTGSVNEDASQVWLASLTARMMNQGSKTMDFKTLSEQVAAMGGQLSVNAGQDQTTISGSVLSDFAADFVKVIADVVMNPAFPEHDLARLKADLKRQLAVQKSQPQSEAESAFRKAIYGDAPYGRMFPTDAMIDSYTVDMVKDFYQKNYGAKRSVLYVAGKFNESTLGDVVNKMFGKWKAGPDARYPANVAKVSPDTIIIERKSAPQTTVIMGIPVTAPGHPDDFPLQVTNSLLGGSFGSRITTNIREDKGYTYSPGSGIANTKGGSVWSEEAAITSEHTIDAIKEIRKEIVRLQNEAPSEEELKGIQNYEAGIFILRNSLPQGIIGQLNFLDQYGLPDTYLTNTVKSIYAVTPAQVSEIAKKYFHPEKMTLVMVGDSDSIQKQMQDSKN